MTLSKYRKYFSYLREYPASFSHLADIRLQLGPQHITSNKLHTNHVGCIQFGAHRHHQDWFVGNPKPWLINSCCCTHQLHLKIELTQRWRRWYIFKKNMFQIDVRYLDIRAHFLSLVPSKLRLCMANHRTGYFSNLAGDWLSIHPSPKVMAHFFRHKNQHDVLIQFAQFLVDLWSVC